MSQKNKVDDATMIRIWRGGAALCDGRSFHARHLRDAADRLESANNRIAALEKKLAKRRRPILRILPKVTPEEAERNVAACLVLCDAMKEPSDE